MSTQQPPILSFLGKGNSHGANQSYPSGPMGVGSTSSMHIGDTACSSTLSTLSKTEKDVLLHKMDNNPPDT